MAAQAAALINGQNYSHNQIIFNYGGVPLLSLSSLEVNCKTLKEFSYGTSNVPVGFGEGRDEPAEVSFEISMAEFLALQRAAGGKGIRGLSPQDIPVTFANPGGPAGLVIKNFMVSEDSFSSDIDNTDIKVPITGIASGAQWK